MKRTLLSAITFICLTLFSCKSPKPAVLPPAEYREIIVERLVPYALPADSTQFYALLACDSLYNVVLKEFSEYKSGRIESQLSLNQDTLSYNTYHPPDTVYVKVADSSRVEKIPYAVKVPVEVNKLTKFQSTQIKIAWGVEIAGLLYLIFGIKWRNIINILKNILKWQ